MKPSTLDWMSEQIKEIHNLLSHLQKQVTALDLRALSKLQSLRANLSRTPKIFRRWEFQSELVKFIDDSAWMNANAGVVIFEVQNLSQFLKTHGPEKTDEHLRQTEARLRSCLDQEGILGRLDWDAFAIVMRGSDVEILARAELSRREMVKPMKVANAAPLLWMCALTAGMSTTSQVGFNAARLMTSAREALEVARSKGGNQIQITKTKLQR